MKRRVKLILIFCISILVATIIALTTSYALFRLNVTKDTDFKVKVGNLELTIDDANLGNTITDGKIIMNAMEPMKEQTALTKDGYNFKLKNTGTIDADYTIYLDDVILQNETKQRLNNNLIRVNLTNNTTHESHTYALTNLTDRVLETGSMQANHENSYTLKIWLDYSADNTAQDKYFAAQIRVEGIQSNSVCSINSGSANNVSMLLSCANVNKNYTTIQEVLNDTTTLQKIINNNRANDYLTISTDWVSAITSNETAMTYIGANDYSANKLLSDNTWLNAIANSTYFEKILNVKVPTMTSNTEPNGEVIYSSQCNNYNPYFAFDGYLDTSQSSNTYTSSWVPYFDETDSYIGYRFTSPVVIKLAKINIFAFVGNRSFSNDDDVIIRGSNDGTTWTNIKVYGSPLDFEQNTTTILNMVMNNNTAYQYYSILFKPILTVASSPSLSIPEAGFYGRAASE